MTTPLDTETIILMLSAVGAFTSIMALALPFLKRNQIGPRQKEFSERRKELNREQREDLAQKSTRERPQASITMIKKLLVHFNLSTLAVSPELRRKLLTAGYRHQSAALIFVFLRFATAFSLLLLTLLFFLADENSDLPFLGQALIIAAGGLFGFWLPAIIIKNATQKRQEDMELAFPEALDLLVICVQAGLSIDSAFARVTEEISSMSTALSQEISLTAAELTFLGDRPKAYDNFYERTGLEGVRSLASALSQADKYGTPVGTALLVLSEESRNVRMSKGESKAAALPAQLTVPMIIFFLPPLFLIVIGPAILQISGQ
jgi:tight adherence protein C